jgi:hypothetical protein
MLFGLPAGSGQFSCYHPQSDLGQIGASAGHTQRAGSLEPHHGSERDAGCRKGTRPGIAKRHLAACQRAQ